jgi:hypothetical protein
MIENGIALGALVILDGDVTRRSSFVKLKVDMP